MALLRSRFLVAFDAGSVAGTIVSPGLGGARMGPWMRVPLPAGALHPSAAETNLVDPQAVADALAAVRAGLGAKRTEAVLVLPEGVARVVLLETPRGVDPRAFARFRLAQALPYPGAEAVVDLLPVARGRYLCGAVRRSVAQSYEALAEAHGLSVDRVDVAPLLATASLKRLKRPGEEGAALFLGDVALSFAAFARGRLAAFRTRLRAPGAEEAAWLVEELSRTTALAGSGSLCRVLVLGSGARNVAQSLQSLGCDAMPASGDEEPSESADRAWMGAAFA